jgi:hypothetical protein
MLSGEPAMDKYTIAAESGRRFKMFKQKTVRAMGTRRCLFIGLIAVFLFVQEGFAAEPEGLKRPKYSPVLRQNEDWSTLAGYDTFKTDSFFDPIKYIPFSDDGNFWMSFGGQARFRLEGWNNFNFNREFDDTFLLTRFRLHTDIHIGKYLRLFAEMKSALSTDRDLPGGRRTLDVDELDLQQAFADIILPVGESGKLTLRPGRQMLLYGKQRLVSPLDWSNTMRTWQGIQGSFDFHNWKISGFWTQFVPVKKYEFNEADSDEPFAGIYATGMPATAGIGLDGYWLYRERKFLDEKRHTLGGRIFGSIGQNRIDYDIEAAYQLGDSGDNDVHAFMIGSQVGYRFIETAFKPRAYLGFDFGSGDKDPNDNKVETFDQTYPLGHPYLGYMDFVGRQNIISPNIGITFNPLNKLTCEATGLFFWRAEEEDALYNAGGGVLRKGAPGTNLEVGQEIDILLKYAYNIHTVILLGYSHFFPGKFIRQTGPDDSADFIYASVEFTF